MDKIKLILLKILLVIVLVTIFSADVVHAKKSKKQSLTLSEEYQSGLDIHHKKIKRSAYSSWARSSSYGLPPYLVYNRKLGAYYPYFKYPENSVRRNLRKMFKQYAASKKYSTLPSHWTNGI